MCKCTECANVQRGIQVPSPKFQKVQNVLNVQMYRMYNGTRAQIGIYKGQIAQELRMCKCTECTNVQQENCLFFKIPEGTECTIV